MSDVREQIMEAALRDAPAEACGFVLDSEAVVHCTNVAEAPWYSFVIDPEEARHWWGTGRVTAVWHSHPTGPAVPSAFDEEMAREGSRALRHLIFSVEDEDLAQYRISNGQLVLERIESPV